MIRHGRRWPLPERLLGWIGAVPPLDHRPLPGPPHIPAYALTGWTRASSDRLPDRLRFLVAQLAALRGGCDYCVHFNRHLALRAGLPVAVVDAVPDYQVAPQFSETERAALSLADALTRFSAAAGGFPAEILVRARCHLPEEQIMALVATVATEHLFDPATGRLGRDVTGAGG